MSLNNNVTDKTYIKLTPFKGWVLENFPFIESDFDCITNYQLLCKMVEYINNVISNQNQVQELGTELVNAYNELLNYVNNYFDDTYPELINNKLDEMVEDGTLQNLLNNYANVQKVYNTYTQLIADESSFINGLRLKTLGYYNIGDGGSAEYVVTNTPNLSKYQIELSNSLYLELVLKNSINPRQLGAYGDNEHDDSQAFQNAINICNNENTYIQLSKGQYKINVTINYDGIKMIGSGNNCILKNYNSNYVIALSGNYCTFKDFNITCDFDGNGCFSISSSHSTFINIKFDNAKNYSLRFINNDFAGANIFTSCNFIRCKNGIYIPANDTDGFANANMFTNCYFDRYWDGVNYYPTLETGTSVLISNSWFQAKNKSGLKINGNLASARITGCRFDSADSTDILIELVNGSTKDNLICDGTSVDGKIEINNVSYTLTELYRTRQVIKTISITGETTANGFLDSYNASTNLPTSTYDIIFAICTSANYGIIISFGGSTHNRYAFRVINTGTGEVIANTSVEIKCYYLTTETY